MTNYKNYQGIIPFNDQFKVQIFRAGKVHYLGLFDDIDEAGLAYDRAQLLSAPWSKRKSPPAYNLGKEPVLPTYENLEKQERQMLDYLRRVDAGAEDLHAERKVVKDQLPDEALTHFETTLEKMYSVGEQLTLAVSGVRSAMVAMIGKVAEKDQYIEFLNGRIRELEGKIRKQDTQDEFERLKSSPNFMKPVGSAAARLAAVKAEPGVPAETIPVAQVQTTPDTSAVGIFVQTPAP